MTYRVLECIIKNNTNLNQSNTMGEWITAVPSAQQFGILEITVPMRGYYTVTAIPYSGSGESFQLLLLMGHQFDPNQQSVYLGKGSKW
jgi:hypothetical protein